jgi:hypothetical protein
LKANFETLAAALAFIINAAGVATLMWLLERAELKGLQSELSTLINSKRSDHPYVRKLCGKLTRELIGWMLLLHVLNLCIYAAVGAVLWIGPENLFFFSRTDPLATPLSTSEKFLLWMWLAISGLVYVVRCISPSFQLVALWTRAYKWLRTNEP